MQQRAAQWILGAFYTSSSLGIEAITDWPYRYILILLETQWKIAT